ncbi:MAG: Crp/Fnr family transcriptional regulator [Citrobacter freundii]|nr:MAG: Crp/Fnr family transcriptional regulator [Citrobacter freundii]
MQTLLNFLNSVKPLSVELQTHLVRILKHKNVTKRQILLKAGHISREIYFIEEGLLRCYYDKGAQEVCTWFMKEGDVIISVESFFSQQPSEETIQAITPCSVWYITHSELSNIYQHYPEFNFIGRVLTEKYYVLLRKELRGLRMQSARERYDWLMEYHSELALRVPSKFLASWLGVGEPYFSTLKSR